MPGASDGKVLAREAERRIRAYERLGIHRTGWGADDAAADWLVEELAAIGVEGRVEEFEFPQLHIRRAELRIGGRTVPGVPTSAVVLPVAPDASAIGIQSRSSCSSPCAANSSRRCEPRDCERDERPPSGPAAACFTTCR